MDIIKSIEKNHFQMIEKRSWSTTYWAFDIHGTMIKPNYQVGNIPTEFYPYCLDTLKILNDREDIVLIISTCSHPHEIDQYLDLFKKHGIIFKYVNKNPEVSSDLEGYGYYEDKFYINVGFDDKYGFDPEIEWKDVYDYLTSKLN